MITRLKDKAVWLLLLIPLIAGICFWFYWLSKRKQDLAKLKADRDAAEKQVETLKLAQQAKAEERVKAETALAAKNVEVRALEQKIVLTERALAEVKSWDDLNKLAGIP